MVQINIPGDERLIIADYVHSIIDKCDEWHETSSGYYFNFTVISIWNNFLRKQHEMFAIERTQNVLNKQYEITFWGNNMKCFQ
jgi:hypothetical protein